MSKTLARLLNQPEQDVAELVFELEKLSGHPALDVKLALEIEKLAKSHTTQLGLDVQDSTDQELYHALLARFAEDNDRFTRVLGGRSHHSHDDIVPLVIKQLTLAKTPLTCWALKRNVAKEILRSCPPKTLLKHLGYRTVDSLLKRERADEIFAAAPYTESAKWSQTFIKAHAKLNPTDFERRQIEVINMPAHRWENLPNRTSVVGYVPSMGTVAIWPTSTNQSFGLALAILILSAVQDLRVKSSWLEFCKVSPNFSRELKKIVGGEFPPQLKLGKQQIAWRSLLYHYGKKPEVQLPNLFENLLNHEDLTFSLPEEILCDLDSELRWWLGLGFVGIVASDKIISLNLTDVAINFANQASYSAASTANLSQTVNDELVSRYLSSTWVEDSILSSLEGGMPFGSGK